MVSIRICTLCSCATALIAKVGFAQTLPLEKFSNPSPPDSTARQREERLKQAVAVRPEFADCWTDLGWRLYKNGKYGEAQWVMGQARIRKPNDPYILWLSGVTSYAQGHYEEAKKYLRDLWERHESYPDTVDIGVAYDILGRVYLHELDLFQAAYFFSKAADEFPGNWQIQFLLGITEWNRGIGRQGEAWRAMSRARELRPRDPIVLKWYAITKAAVDVNWPQETDPHFTEAINSIRAAIATNPNDPDNYELLGQVYAAGNDTAKAVEALRRAVYLNANGVGPNYFLAKVLYLSQGGATRQEVQSLLVKSIALEPGFMHGDTSCPHAGLLISILTEEGNVSQAQALVDWMDTQVNDRD